MDSMNGRSDGPLAALGAALSAAARFVVALFGALLMVGALFIGLLVGLTLMLFALLRGRKPQGVKFVWRKGDWPGRPAAGRSATSPVSGEVVDIEARELPAQPPHER
jgi:hypothetical protein